MVATLIYFDMTYNIRSQQSPDPVLQCTRALVSSSRSRANAERATACTHDSDMSLGRPTDRVSIQPCYVR